MKLSLAFAFACLFAAFVAIPSLAQPPAVNASTRATNSTTEKFSAPLDGHTSPSLLAPGSTGEHRLATPPVLLSQTPREPRDDVMVGASYQLNGPLVGPLKAVQAKKFFQAPLRLLQAVNPLAATLPQGMETREDGLSTRAWTTVAGWNPGASFMDDPVTHEPEMNLLTISRSPQQ
jgi:hypothetical protein